MPKFDWKHLAAAMLGAAATAALGVLEAWLRGDASVVRSIFGG